MITLSSRIKRVVMVQPASAGGNFEYVAIPRQGMLFLSGALAQWEGTYLYEREIWFEDRSGLMNPDRDLEGADILMVTALINEAPRAYQIARQAKQYHPEIITIGGGPQMSPLPKEAIELGGFDVIVNREGEDIIGSLCDVLLNYGKSPMLNAYLEKIPGISFTWEGQLVQTRRRGTIEPDFVELPDFRSIKDLTKDYPMAAGVIETVRGCTEKCTYCQVIQQFLGYRLIRRETEKKRLGQLRELASDGLIHTRGGRLQVFISDDLHPPPLRAVKYRNERLERLKEWRGLTDDMYLICQARAEIGQDTELANAMFDANIKMLYLGVESNNAENLKAVRKRQEPGQMEQDLKVLNSMDFSVVAMTIIGLPYDTEEDIMNLAEWVTQFSRYQTANLLTPLPATSNWDSLTPLNEQGDLLAEGEIRPYHLYTGRQFVFYDERWSMQESRDLFDRYSDKLTSIDTLYGRIFRMLRSYKLRLAATSRELGDSINAQLTEAVEGFRKWRELHDVNEQLTHLNEDLSDAVRTVSQPLVNERRELQEAVSRRAKNFLECIRGESDSLPSISAQARDLIQALNAVLYGAKPQQPASGE